MKVFSNLAISLDGRIADRDHPHKALGTPLDRKIMQLIRAKSDVIVVGAETLRVSGTPIKIRGASAKKSQKKNSHTPANAVVSASGKLDPKWSFWDAADVIRFVFTTDQGLESARRAAQDRAFVVSCGAVRVSIEALLLRLKQSDYQNVLVEGGGRLIGEFLSENFLQELFVTHTPWILGGPDNPLLVSNPLKFEKWKQLKVLQSQRKKSETYAHYQVKGARRV